MATIRVCDVCMVADRPVEQYAIRSEGRSVEVDLCNEHADSAPLRRLLNEGQPEAPPRLRPLPREVSLTMDEIEKLKRGQSGTGGSAPQE